MINDLDQRVNEILEETEKYYTDDFHCGTHIEAMVEIIQEQQAEINRLKSDSKSTKSECFKKEYPNG